ncbi:distal membrane-arm assembly complex protein 2 [Spea bombifrons]|uniref:distal membrane-arm assembly complex protein 2 n=1 Tax=Spea bombifrons TaxID=233779 RepID=UPI00234AF0A3|nr:distal membrane-arm assembly complex protein 2 [Spea bombifrons]
MAAPSLLRVSRLLLPVGRQVARRCSSAPSPAPSTTSLGRRILQALNRHFYDVEAVTNWSIRFKHWNLRRKNAHYAYTERLYGRHVAAAYYTLSQGGAVRFQGHSDWLRPDRKGRFSWDFLQNRNVPVECVDLSRSPITYRGLDNIVPVAELRELHLRGCPHLDDWALSRLHVFKDSLEVLSVASCPRVTERGLSTLHHLQRLRYLDVSDLPAVQNKGLMRILLEEALPRCDIIGMDYFQGIGEEEAGAPATRL